MFFDLVCEAAARGPVIVGLEFPETSQAALDRWLASNGDGTARAALLREPFWRFRDGRASEAMLELLERLRRLRASGRRLSLLLFVPRSADSLTTAQYERAMAANWRRALARMSGARLLVLVGNIHSRQARHRDFEPAGMHMPPNATLTFGPLTVGGSTYNCYGADCGAHPAGSTPAIIPPRGVIPTPPQAVATMPYNYLYSPGRPFTPSPPAVPAP